MLVFFLFQRISRDDRAESNWSNAMDWNLRSVHTTLGRNLKTVFSLQKRIKRFPYTHYSHLMFEENSGREIIQYGQYDYHDDIVFGKRFPIPSRRKKAKPVFSNSSGLRRGFSKNSVGRKLPIPIIPAWCGHCLSVTANSNNNTPPFPLCTILFDHSWREVVRVKISNLELIYKLQYSIDAILNSVLLVWA